MEKLTPAQWKDRTMKDLAIKKALKAKGMQDADSYQYDARLRSFKRMSKIRCKSYRGR